MELSEFKVLIAEDNKVNQVVISKMLALMGIRADLAKDGNEALEMVKSNTYNLVLMDVQMPYKDGIQATREIREYLGENNELVIVALTANAFRDNKEECLKAGMNDFLPKPIDLNALKEMVHKWSGNGITDKQ